jgi:hypothetical protein
MFFADARARRTRNNKSVRYRWVCSHGDRDVARRSPTRNNTRKGKRISIHMVGIRIRCSSFRVSQDRSSAVTHKSYCPSKYGCDFFTTALRRSIIYAALTDKFERKCHLPSPGWNCMTHRQALEGFVDASQILVYKNNKIN